MSDEIQAAGIPSVCTDSGNGQLDCTTNLSAIKAVDRDGSSTSGISIAKAPIAATATAPFIPLIGTQKFNFVAGDRFTCENSIQSRLRLTASCKIGGGCGLSCGVPNGTTCLSANPSTYGTWCLTILRPLCVQHPDLLLNSEHSGENQLCRVKMKLKFQHAQYRKYLKAL